MKIRPSRFRGLEEQPFEDELFRKRIFHRRFAKIEEVQTFHSKPLKIPFAVFFSGDVSPLWWEWEGDGGEGGNNGLEKVVWLRPYEERTPDAKIFYGRRDEL